MFNWKAATHCQRTDNAHHKTPVITEISFEEIVNLQGNLCASAFVKCAVVQ
jgi:hypothetical protein